MHPGARAASGRHPALSVLRRGEPGARRPAGGAAGPQRGQPVRGRRARPASPQHPAAPRIPPPAAYLRGVALGSGAHSHGPLPALLRRGPGGSGGSAAGPGSSWGLAKRRGGGAGVPGPAARSLPGAGGGFVCARGVLGALRLAAASRRSWPAGGSRRPGARRPLLLLRGAPSPPAALLTDGATAPTRHRRRRGFSQLLSLMLGLLRIPRGAGGGRDPR